MLRPQDPLRLSEIREYMRGERQYAQEAVHGNIPRASAQPLTYSTDFATD